MLYPNNKNDRLDDGLFMYPGNEYRGAPFWAWNSALEEEHLTEQIDIFKKMGFGGFHMHVRQGLETAYLGTEFMNAVKICVNKAQAEGMYAWLYDEDRWPSGCAGGKVTEDIRRRQRYLLMTKCKLESCAETYDEAYTEGKPYFLAAFFVRVDESGFLTDYEKSDEDAADKNHVFFYCMTQQGGEPRYNLQTYSDNLLKETVDQFIRITHEAYKKEIGEFFGKTVPAIFTDEPRMIPSLRLENGFSDQDAILPFTLDFPETFETENHYPIVDRLPELFYACHANCAKKTRYDYYRHLNIRFHSAYGDNIGKWCQRNGLISTGHAIGEDCLEDMTHYGYEAMRFYKEMELPGIDMLFDNRAFTTAIQCRSVVRQCGREGMLSELYGVTGWDFDFRGHKFQGDWQACLGVTVRVPHLAWQSMKGEGKRDYPASVFYQSPWFLEYSYLEDHYARIATALTRGRAMVRIGIIHPLESYWTERASDAETMPLCEELEEHFHQLAEWLVRGLIEFDYLSESLLPDLCKEGNMPLQVGESAYDVIIACDCVTLRQSTLSLLEGFKRGGGKLIIMGKHPYMCEGEASKRAADIADGALSLPFSKYVLLKELESCRDIEIRDHKGAAVSNFMYTMRVDGDRKWLFIAHADKPALKHTVNGQKLLLKIRGVYEPVQYDTLAGRIRAVPYVIHRPKDENHAAETWIRVELFDTDSLLLALSPRTVENVAAGAESFVLESEKDATGQEIAVSCEVKYTLSEPNVLLLDMAQYRIDGGEWNETEEIMRIDEAVRTQLGLALRRTKVIQPYLIKDSVEDHLLELRYTVVSERQFDNVMLALENPEKCRAYLNGKASNGRISGYYVDEAIKVMELGRILEGENIIDLKMSFGLRTDLEACYLLGNFGTKYYGRQQFLCAMPEKLYFGSIVNQGFAFYGGNITYHTKLELDEDCDIETEVTYYSGALIRVTLDKRQTKRLVFSPYKVTFENVRAGRHTIDFELYGNRYNTFSALHTLLADKEKVYIGPDYWRSSGDGWAYEYQTRPFGILKTPVARKVKRPV